jgi:hypothetical protein
VKSVTVVGQIAVGLNGGKRETVRSDSHRIFKIYLAKQIRLIIAMGGAASVNEFVAQEVLKPGDASDLQTLEEARAEVARLRKMAKDFSDTKSPRIIMIIFGPPGGGKGTRAPFLTQAFQIPQLSTGDLLREAVRSGSELGKAVEEVMKSGALVEDKVCFIIRLLVFSIDMFYSLLWIW